MTTETLTFLLALLDTQQLSVGAPEFEKVAAQVVAARRELIEAIKDASEEPAELLQRLVS